MVISIVIPTYNNHEPLHRTLASLNNIPDPEYKVTTVEDCLRFFLPV